MIIPAVLGLAVVPFYLLSADYFTTVLAFTVQGFFFGGMYGQNPSYLSERFPTEVRATAAASAITRVRSGAAWRRRS